MKTSNLKIKKFTLVNSFKESVWPIYECLSLEDFMAQLKKHPEIKDVLDYRDGQIKINWWPRFKRWPWKIWIAEIKGKKVCPIAKEIYMAQVSIENYISTVFYNEKAKDHVSLLEIYPEIGFEMKAILDRYKNEDLIKKVEQFDRYGDICF